jgi:hypothetical protein
MNAWGIVRLTDEDPRYSSYAIKKPDSNNFYLYEEDEVINYCVSSNVLLRYKRCSIVNNYQHKKEAIQLFHELDEDHNYNEDDYFFDGHSEEEEWEDE